MIPFGTEQEPNQKLELFKEAISQVYEKKDIEVRTELNPTQILLFANAKFLAERYKIPALDTYIKNIMELSLSKGRKSRLEAQATAKALLQSETEQQQKPTLMDNLFGKR